MGTLPRGSEHIAARHNNPREGERMREGGYKLVLCHIETMSSLVGTITTSSTVEQTAV